MKALTNQKKMFGYNVTIKQYQNHYEHDGEQFGGWSSEHTNLFQSVKKVDEACPDLVTVEDLQIGDIVYVVWVEWSSGDSFGHGHRSSTESLAVFSKASDAVNFQQILEADGVCYKFIASTGQKFESAYCPWYGYFESLDDVNVTEAIIE